MKRIKTYKEYKLLYFDKLIEQIYNGTRYFYIYRITDLKNSKHYYGSRVSNEHPIFDLGVHYFSSSRDIEFLQAQRSYNERFRYKIIKIFDNNIDKILYESFLHQYFDVKSNKKFFNIVNQTATSFDTTGFVTCLNLLTDEICFITKEEFDYSYNLVGIGYGMVNCIDIRTDRIIRVSKEEFNSNINLVGISYGKVTCIDKISGKYKQVTKEEFDSNPDLVGVVYNTVNCIDKETNKTKQVTKEEFDTNPNLVGVLYDIVTCIDKETNKTKQVTKEEFYSDANLVGISSNMVNCLDSTTNKIIQVTKEEFYTNDEFVSINDNMVVCKYIGTDEIIRVTKEEFDSNINLVGTTHGAKLDFTQEHKDNIRKGTVGKPKSESQKKNMSLANKGRVACKLIGTEEIIFVSQEEFDSNPNLVGSTNGFIQCICTITGERININPLDLCNYKTFVPLNAHKVYTLKYPNGDIKILTDTEYIEEKETRLLSHNALMKSYTLNKPVEQSFDFYNKTFNRRIKNSIGFQILHIEKKLY